MPNDGPVRADVSNGIGRIVIDNPPVNALSHDVRAGLLSALAELEKDRSCAAVVILAAGRLWSAGADIREFERPTQDPLLPGICTMIEDCPKPVVAALHGSVLGGGLELALGAHYRIALADTLTGLPEVSLGLQPEAGGTQRLPRIVGAGPALEMILGGKPVTAQQALAAGLIDKIVTRELATEAQEFAQNLVEQRAGPRKTCARAEGFRNPEEYWTALGQAKDRVNRLHPDLMAPRLAVQCVEAAQMLPFAQGLALERSLFDDCVASPQSAALRYGFFAERKATKPPSGTVEPRVVDQIAVVGAGRAGTHIAQTCLGAGLPVTLIERNAGTLRSAEKRLNRLKAKLTLTGNLGGVRSSDVVIDATADDFDLKSELFGKLGELAGPEAILATNSSDFDVNALAQKTDRARDLIGFHFVGVQGQGQLVEIIPGAETDPAVTRTLFQLAGKLGKTAIRSGTGAGFVANAMMLAFREAADYLLEAGANPPEIDAAMRGFGFPSGPFQMLDAEGLDIDLARRSRRSPEREADARKIDINTRLLERDWRGRDSGRGFYRYTDDASRGVEDPEVAALIDEAREEAGIVPKTFPDEEIQRQCVLAMMNEGARLVAERVAQRPSDVDCAMIHGFGYPAWRGGPMYQADRIGVAEVLLQLDEMTDLAPGFWSPSALILRLAEENRAFADLN